MKPGILSKTGSFWGNHLNRTDFVALSRVADIAAQPQLLQRLTELADIATGSEVIKRDIAIPIKERQMSSGELASFASIEGMRARFGDALDTDANFPTPDGDVWHMCQIPDDLAPVAVRINRKVLVEGIDLLSSYGLMLIRAAACVDGIPSVIEGVVVRQKAKSALNFLTGDRPHASVVDFMRKGQSIVSLERAAASCAGMYVFDVDDEIVGFVDYNDATVYSTRYSGQINITYPHTRLSIGSGVSRGYIIRGRFEILQATSAAHIVSFFSAFPEVSMDWVLPFKGLRWDPRSTVACISNEAHGGKPHAKLILNGDEGALNAWHAAQRRADLAYPDNTLADAVGMVSVGETVDVDFAELLWTRYGSRLLLLANANPQHEAAIYKFVEENKPVSAFILKNYYND